MIVQELGFRKRIYFVGRFLLLSCLFKKIVENLRLNFRVGTENGAGILGGCRVVRRIYVFEGLFRSFVGLNPAFGEEFYGFIE